MTIPPTAPSDDTGATSRPAPTPPESDGTTTARPAPAPPAGGAQATGGTSRPTPPSTPSRRQRRKERRARKVTHWDRPPPPIDWRWFVGNIGKVLITLGLLMFGFVAYQLWGTAIETARAQNSLENDFEEMLAEVDPVAPPTTVAAPAEEASAEEASAGSGSSSDDAAAGGGDAADAATDAGNSADEGRKNKKNKNKNRPAAERADAEEAGAGEVPATLLPAVVPAADQNIPDIEEGDAVARLEIPRLGTDHIVVAGVSWGDLKKGPGHYPDTPLPGQLGNSAIAGHRTTYGQPFYSINELEVGDEIHVTTLSGRFTYRVTGQEIVGPSEYQVVATTDPTVANLTLTSCHPRWTAQQRIVVYSELVNDVSDPVGETVVNYGRPSAFPDVGAVEVPVDDPVIDVGSDLLPDQTAIADAFAEGWFSDPGAPPQVALWGLVLGAIGLGAYLVARHFRRDWIGLAVGILPFLVALYFFYQNVNRLLPPNL